MNPRRVVDGLLLFVVLAGLGAAGFAWKVKSGIARSFEQKVRAEYLSDPFVSFEKAGYSLLSQELFVRGVKLRHRTESGTLLEGTIREITLPAPLKEMRAGTLVL